MIASLTHAPVQVLQMLSDARRQWLAVGTSTGGCSPQFQVLATGDVLSTAVSSIESAIAPVAHGREAVKVAYDVVRFRGGKGLFTRDHMQRLHRSVAALYDVNISTVEGNADVLAQWIKQCTEAVHKVAEQQGQDDEQNVKIIVWRSSETADVGTDLVFCAFFIDSFYPPKSWYDVAWTAADVADVCSQSSTSKRPVFACLYDAARENPELKIVQAALRQRAVEQQKRLHAFESLLVHSADDHFLAPEGSRSNYILVKGNGDVVSSMESDILMGITLLATRRHCITHGISFEHRRLTLADVVHARSICMLGTSVGVLPIESLITFSTAAEQQLFENAMKLHEEGAVGQLQQLLVVETQEGGTLVGRRVYNSAKDPVVQELIRFYEGGASSS